MWARGAGNVWPEELRELRGGVRRVGFGDHGETSGAGWARGFRRLRGPGGQGRRAGAGELGSEGGERGRGKREKCFSTLAQFARAGLIWNDEILSVLQRLAKAVHSILQEIIDEPR